MFSLKYLYLSITMKENHHKMLLCVCDYMSSLIYVKFELSVFLETTYIPLTYNK